MIIDPVCATPDCLGLCPCRLDVDISAGKIVVQLKGRINKAGVISPRYNVHLSQLEKWVVKLLPARQFGVSFIVVMQQQQSPVLNDSSTSSSPLQLVSWTTRRLVDDMSLARLSVSFIKRSNG